MANAVTIRPDAKRRITLSKLARGVNSFQAATDEKGRITTLEDPTGRGEDSLLTFTV